NPLGRRWSCGGPSSGGATRTSSPHGSSGRRRSPGSPTPSPPLPCPAADSAPAADMSPLHRPTVRTVFIHGRGRSGPSAWPLAAAEEDPTDVFLERAGLADQPERDADRVVDALGGRGHLVAHSYGTVTAMLAAQ